MLTRKKILLSVAGAALIIRMIFALSFHCSFFESYHLVPGLDMQTLLRFSEWGDGYNHPPFFTIHRIVIYLDWLCGGKTHQIWTIFIIQALMGVLGSVCIADLILKFSRARKAALITGIISAAYLPTLIYEFSILQESFMVYFALFSFWATLNALHKRFSPGSSVIFFLSFFAALSGRPAALFMCGTMIIFAGYKMWKRHQIKKLFLPLAALAIVFTATAYFNWYHNKIFSPFYNVMPYTLQFNADAALRDKDPSSDAPASSDANPQQSGLLQAGMLAVKRVPTLFKHGELPENQNIYFWCEKLPELNYYPAPGAVIPIAVAGIMVLIFSGAWKKRYGLLLLPVIMLALPLCARDPIGRYRLMLIPYFFIIAACAVMIFLRLKNPKLRGMALFGAALGAFFSIYNGDVPQRIRPYDYSAWAIAMENTPGTPDEDVLSAYYDHWQAYNFRSDLAFCMLMDKCLEKGRIDLAVGIAQKAMAEETVNQDLIHYFLAWCFALNQDPHSVHYHLTHILHPEELPPDMQQKYIILSNDTRRILTIMEN